jgi:hypothetical protein
MVTTALGYTPPTTWRSITDSVSTTSSEISGSATAVKTAYDKAVAAYNLANGKTSNTGTVTKVTAGTGLSGGDITTSGSISISSTFQTYITNGNTAHSWGNHASAGYIKGITKSMVTTALGYTPPTSDTNTHYTTRLYAGASGTAANAAATNPYLKVTDDNTYRNQIQFKGGGSTTVSSDANGVITISSTDTNTNTWRPLSFNGTSYSGS